MFKRTEVLLYGLQEAQRLIEEKIAEMQYYYLMPGTKKDLVQNYGFTKETSNEFIRITKVGWMCFTHDIVSSKVRPDDEVELPELINPPEFGWAVPVSDVPDEVIVCMLDDNITKCRFVESRNAKGDYLIASIRQLKAEPTGSERVYNWSKTTYWAYDSPKNQKHITKENIDTYLAELSLHRLFYARKVFAYSINYGSICIPDDRY